MRKYEVLALNSDGETIAVLGSYEDMREAIMFAKYINGLGRPWKARVFER